LLKGLRGRDLNPTICLTDLPHRWKVVVGLDEVKEDGGEGGVFDAVNGEGEGLEKVVEGLGVGDGIGDMGDADGAEGKA